MVLFPRLLTHIGDECADSGGRTAEEERRRRNGGGGTAEVTRTADGARTAEVLSMAGEIYFIYLKLYNVQVTLLPRLLTRIGDGEVCVRTVETWDPDQVQI